MNEILKNHPKRRSLVWRLCRWLFLVVGAITVFQSGYFLVTWLITNCGIAFPPLWEKVCFALVNLIAVVFVCWLVRKPDGQPTLMRRALSQVFSKRMVPRYLFCLACLATLLAVFYVVEDWRGKRAWENCRRELEAKGEVLDWNAYIPAPVPDDQNIFKAPRMTEWFVKQSWAAAANGKPSKSRDTNAPFSLSPAWNTKRHPVLLAQVEVVPPDKPLPPGKADAVLQFDDPAAREQAAKLLDGLTGPRVEAAQAFVIVARALDHIKPVTLVLQADHTPSGAALTEFLSPTSGLNLAGATPSRGFLQVERVGSHGFRVSLSPSVYGAAEHLALSQPAVPDLDLLRKALERPYARMDGDYQRPFERPFPNFVRLRNVAQMLSQRAQCYLLLGQPEAAWDELALIRDMCRLLEGSPPRKATTLVEAMIDVAITGLYTQVIEDGLRLEAWREPELATMQKQLQDVDLLPLLHQAMNAQRAAVCRLYETTSPAEFKNMFFFGTDRPALWDKLKDPKFLLMKFTPRGWIYQNMCTLALCDQFMSDSVALSSNQISPRSVDRIGNQVQAAFDHSTPYTFLGARAVPNYVKASQALARTQTRVNEAFIACGLERYRLAHGQYPETLDALVPQFAEKLPHDIVGGQPLKYHRTADGQFVLYSVGWNEQDDGGVPGKTDRDGDWVWRPVASP